jgi:hypothetical protein
MCLWYGRRLPSAIRSAADAADGPADAKPSYTFFIGRHDIFGALSRNFS